MLAIARSSKGYGSTYNGNVKGTSGTVPSPAPHVSCHGATPIELGQRGTKAAKKCGSHPRHHHFSLFWI